jgi:hypothetical protein
LFGFRILWIFDTEIQTEEAADAAQEDTQLESTLQDQEAAGAAQESAAEDTALEDQQQKQQLKKQLLLKQQLQEWQIDTEDETLEVNQEQDLSEQVLGAFDDASRPATSSDLPEGAQEIVDDVDSIESTSTSPSEILGAALEKIGEPKPGDNYEAHHIIPWNHPDAEPARSILEEVGIDINDAANGVWLANVPKGSNSPRGTVRIILPTMVDLTANNI